MPLIFGNKHSFKLYQSFFNNFIFVCSSIPQYFNHLCVFEKDVSLILLLEINKYFVLFCSYPIMFYSDKQSKTF